MALMLGSISSSLSATDARPLPFRFAVFGFASSTLSSSLSERRTPLLTLTPLAREGGREETGVAEVRVLVFAGILSSSESDRDMTADGLFVPRFKNMD